MLSQDIRDAVNTAEKVFSHLIDQRAGSFERAAWNTFLSNLRNCQKQAEEIDLRIVPAGARELTSELPSGVVSLSSRRRRIIPITSGGGDAA
jgi:hypothetical protein